MSAIKVDTVGVCLSQDNGIGNHTPEVSSKKYRLLMVSCRYTLNMLIGSSYKASNWFNFSAANATDIHSK